eukprot:TRINITY_DN3317_c0_g1_i2.p1 TRINITY_DN3317_c0_g1~~TRINITY_DN3317_c0_g1_i2.p1  ORF type:complete len:313 (-),score=40.83 TRINITY_DN3317_c0_g1_i2:103-1041(-)
MSKECLDEFEKIVWDYSKYVDGTVCLFIFAIVLYLLLERRRQHLSQIESGRSNDTVRWPGIYNEVLQPPTHPNLFCALVGSGCSFFLTFIFFLCLHSFPDIDFASLFTFFTKSPYFLSLLFLSNVFFSSYFASNYSKEITLYLLSPQTDYNTYILFTENKIYLRAGFLSVLSTSVPFLLALSQIPSFSIPKTFLSILVWSMLSIIVCSVGSTFGSKAATKSPPIPPLISSSPSHHLPSPLIRLNPNSPSLRSSSSSSSSSSSTSFSLSSISNINWSLFNNLSYLVLYSIIFMLPNIPGIYISTAPGERFRSK